MYAKDNDNGVLVSLKPGTYPIISSPTETRAFRSLDETTQGLLVEYQGVTPDRGDEGECWYALVHGEILVVWGDHLVGENESV